MTKDLLLSERELLDQSLEFVKSITIKNPYMARKYETTAIAQKADIYLYTLDHSEEITFSYYEYDENDLITVGITNPEVIKLFLSDISLIPKSYHKEMLKNKITRVIVEYEEENDYYRMLNGYPSLSLNKLNYIYVTVTNEDGEKVNKPIHTITKNEFFQIKKSGEYDRILKENPTENYLFYINPVNKISFYEARKAKDFYIMNYNKSCLNELYTKQLIDFYYEVLVYTMSVVYTPAFKNQDYYDSFIIIYMLTATLQKFLNNNVNNIIRRDIYDLESARNMFASYGLPFFEEIPLKYQRKILQNLNHLLAYKGTDTIFVDLAHIFGFDDTEIYRYYLVKDYVRDEGGLPVDLDSSNIENVELKFAQVPTGSKDISSYLNSDFLYQTYDEVVSDDPYWGENEYGEIDEEMKNELKEMDFNYVATKYLSSTTIFNMSESAFETCYFFNLMNTMFHKNLLDDLYFYSSSIKNDGTQIKLFSAITAVYILLFRRFGYVDFLPKNLTTIASVYGFNFDTDLKFLKELMYDKSEVDIEGRKIYHRNNECLQELTKILDLPNNPTKADIINTFFESKNFNKSLHEAILKTDDIRVYRALNALHTYNMYSQAINKLYGDKYGSTREFDTFSDWLQKEDETLYNWVNANSLDESDPSKINKELTIKALDTVLESLELYFNSNTFSNLFINTNITIDLIRKYFLQMISVFKAYTVEIKKVNIYYLFNDRYLNSIKLFSYIKWKAKLSKGDSIEYNLADEITRKVKKYINDENLKGLTEYVDTIVRIFKDDTIDLSKFEFIKTAILKKADSIKLPDELGYNIKIKLNENEIRIQEYMHKYMESLIKHDDINMMDKRYLENNSKYADVVHLVNDTQTSGSMIFNDGNKIINGREELQFFVSYKK